MQTNPLLQYLSCEATQENDAINSNLRDITSTVLSTLTEREERVIRLRFGIGMNTDHTYDEITKDDEIAEGYSVGRERIRQIEAKALRKLKHPSRSRRLRSFCDMLYSFNSDYN